MSRDDIVKATYDGALMLLDIKAKYGIIDKGKVEMIKSHIKSAVEIIRKLDASEDINDNLRSEIFRLNELALLCEKQELDWPVKGWRIKPLGIFKLLFGRS